MPDVKNTLTGSVTSTSRRPALSTTQQVRCTCIEPLPRGDEHTLNQIIITRWTASADCAAKAPARHGERQRQEAHCSLQEANIRFFISFRK
ncbi:hypothetical protein [Xylella fastidiosa]|uniref:hypothetical protein n=1 Tax=Xylella fastidiosa TaxID=2371 RepID=UPI002416BA6A|nr:hypothetical protein [Xylella fastidiosa]MDG4872833.1 hypothetical protein [Xylella fastidiosa subsp. multiplex]